MRSYGFYTRDASAMTKQVQEIIAKVKAGEYQTEEECIAAFRAHVGGGAASELFYKSLEQLAKGQWKTYIAGIEAKLEQEANEAASRDMADAQRSQTASDAAMTQANQNALSGEDNTVTGTAALSREQIIDLGRKVTRKEREQLRPVKKKYRKAKSLDDRLFGLGLASLSEQEEAILDYNQDNADAALARALALKTKLKSSFKPLKRPWVLRMPT